MDSRVRVGELVKWVESLCTEAIRAGEMRQGCTNHSFYAEILTKQILSHSDLALIEECEMCEGKGWLSHDDIGEPNPPVGGTRCPMCEGTGIIPISLVAALKESNDERI